MGFQISRPSSKILLSLWHGTEEAEDASASREGEGLKRAQSRSGSRSLRHQKNQPRSFACSELGGLQEDPTAVAGGVAYVVIWGRFAYVEGAGQRQL